MISLSLFSKIIISDIQIYPWFSPQVISNIYIYIYIYIYIISFFLFLSANFIKDDREGFGVEFF